MDFQKLLEGAGSFTVVFIGMGLVIGWLLKEVKRCREGWTQATERLLEERETRANENQEAAKLLATSEQALTQHDKMIERLLTKWDSLRG